MEEEKKLYPFRFCELEDKYVWGSEIFKLADLGYRDSLVRDGWLAGNTISEVMDMYMDRIVGEDVFKWYGRQFPFQIKHIRVNGDMPLRVHPSDETASERYDLLGKEKMWYILSAGKDACLGLGFKEECDATRLLEKCENNSAKELLNIQCPHSGDSFHIAPGTVHAAFGEMEILEVSESSPLDFCLCSWGQTLGEDEFDSALSAIDALDFIDYKAYRHDCAPSGKEETAKKLVSLPEFTVSRMKLTDPLHIYTDKFDSFLCYYCTNGEASVQLQEEDGKSSSNTLIKKGEMILIPSECPDFIIAPMQTDTCLIEAMVEKRDDADSYINPNVGFEHD